jgi:hypothetical protein
VTHNTDSPTTARASPCLCAKRRTELRAIHRIYHRERRESAPPIIDAQTE